jgi:hypothetical protein
MSERYNSREGGEKVSAKREEHSGDCVCANNDERDGRVGDIHMVVV